MLVSLQHIHVVSKNASCIGNNTIISVKVLDTHQMFAFITIYPRFLYTWEYSFALENMLEQAGDLVLLIL